MKIRLKNFLAELRRRYIIIFETRDLETIRKDYYDRQWISKEELGRLFVYEVEQLTAWALRERADKNAVIEGFNLATMRNHYENEERLVKSGRLF
jgi:hypothetical protein